MAVGRLDKLLCALHCGSRKEVGALVRAGRVQVAGVVVRDPAYKVDAQTAALTLDGVPLAMKATVPRTLMLNKPAGVITASHDARHKTVLDLLSLSERRGLFAVGRLDKDTEGLLLLTEDGALSHALMHPRRHVEKEYEAVVDTLPPDHAVHTFAEGVVLRDGVCRPAQLCVVASTPPTVRVTLCEGRYHQVKRMLASVGSTVLQLRRVRLGGLWLDPALVPGAYRALTEDELRLLTEQPTS